MNLLQALSSRLRRYAEKDGRGYPDWAARYRPIVRRRGIRWNIGRVLEIGANANGIARFTGKRVTAIDIAQDHLREAREAQPILPAVADLRSLPFPDSAFIRIVCVDVFEHIDAGARGAAVAEMRRCLAPRGTLVLAFPTGKAAERTESQVQRAYRDYTGGSLRWLNEHGAVGLPDATAMDGILTSAFGNTHTVTKQGNLNVHVWSWMWRVLMCGWPGRGNSVFQVLLRWMTPVITRLHLAPCYRVIFFVEPRTGRPPS